jgi:hypothetical protein
VRVFYYLEDRERTLDSPTDKILLAVSGFADEVEREKARQRTYDAMRRKAEAGHVTGGLTFDYANVRVNGHVAREINPAEAAVVTRIFELAASGAGARRTAHALNAEGALSPAPRRNGRPRAWAPSSVRAILTRSLYRARSSGIGARSGTPGASDSRGGASGRPGRSSGTSWSAGSRSRRRPTGWWSSSATRRSGRSSPGRCSRG